MSLIVRNPISLPGLGEHPALRVGAALLVAVVLAVAAVAKLAFGSLSALWSGQEVGAARFPEMSLPRVPHQSPLVIEEVDERKDLGGPDETHVATKHRNERGDGATATVTPFAGLD